METVESRVGRKEKLLQDYAGSVQPRGLSALNAAACLVLSESDLGERAGCIQRPSVFRILNKVDFAPISVVK
jgi:hypothetical protein